MSPEELRTSPDRSTGVTATVSETATVAATTTTATTVVVSAAAAASGAASVQTNVSVARSGPDS